jgi:NAD(P)H-dependent FMN reductase
VGTADAGLITWIADDRGRLPRHTQSGLRSILADADVVLFCTPEYAGSLPGSLNNLIDWTVGIGDRYQMSVAWINVAATGRGADASQDLARVLGHVDARVLTPGGIQLPLDPASIGPDHDVVDEDYRDRLLRGLVGLAKEHRRRGRFIQ